MPGTGSTAGRGRQCLFGRAAEKVAGGVGAGHRAGVVDVEDQGKVQRVGAGGQGFVQDAIAPDLFEGDAVQLVLVKVAGVPVAIAENPTNPPLT